MEQVKHGMINFLEMEYRIIPGIREGSSWVHVILENRVYVLKTVRNGIKEYICYQSILSAPKRNKIVTEPNCTARVKLHPDGRLEKGHALHTRHNNHDAVIRNAEARNQMKEDCKIARVQIKIIS